MKYIKLGLLTGLSVMISACGSSGPDGHDFDYTEAKAIPPLVVPAGMKSPVKKGYFIAPLHSETRQQAQLSLIPPGSNLKRFDKKSHK